MPRKAKRPPGAGGGPIRIERYKGGRHWAVYDRAGLVAVTVYRKGARAVASRLVPAATRRKKEGRPPWN